VQTRDCGRKRGGRRPAGTRPASCGCGQSALLHQVTSRIDSARDAGTIATLVSDDFGRTLTADQVRYLIGEKLLPLGIVADQGAPSAPLTASPLLALRARDTLLPARAAGVGASGPRDLASVRNGVGWWP
jgi:hypothetical protein